GRRPAGVGVINAYVRRLQAAAAHDARLGTTVLRVSSLVDPPGRLLHPATVARVLLARRSGREAREALGETPGVSRPRAR
ncbi:MAG: FAD-binding monooxygenase, partial [Thermocrispum sp.]